MGLRIEYGTEDSRIDVTRQCIYGGDKVFIPAGDDERSRLFSDPVPYKVKFIIVVDDNGAGRFVDGPDSLLFGKRDGRFDLMAPATFTAAELQQLPPTYRLQVIHNQIRFSGGSLRDELVEQEMSTRFLRPTDTVLELGGHYGRNSCVIASMLDDTNRHVVCECIAETAERLLQNRDQNGFRFRVEVAAVSARPLSCTVDSVTQSADGLSSTGVGTRVLRSEEDVALPTISWSDIKAKHVLELTALVADCEGALYQILQDEPTFLAGFKTLILENDYQDAAHAEFVWGAIKMAGFRKCFQRPGGWGPCADRFWEAWTRG